MCIFPSYTPTHPYQQLILGDNSPSNIPLKAALGDNAFRHTPLRPELRLSTRRDHTSPPPSAPHPVMIPDDRPPPWAAATAAPMLGTFEGRARAYKPHAARKPKTAPSARTSSAAAAAAAAAARREKQRRSGPKSVSFRKPRHAAAAPSRAASRVSADKAAAAAASAAAAAAAVADQDFCRKRAESLCVSKLFEDILLSSDPSLSMHAAAFGDDETSAAAAAAAASRAALFSDSVSCNEEEEGCNSSRRTPSLYSYATASANATPRDPPPLSGAPSQPLPRAAAAGFAPSPAANSSAESGGSSPAGDSDSLVVVKGGGDGGGAGGDNAEEDETTVAAAAAAACFGDDEEDVDAQRQRKRHHSRRLTVRQLNRCIARRVDTCVAEAPFAAAAIEAPQQPSTLALALVPRGVGASDGLPARGRRLGNIVAADSLTRMLPLALHKAAVDTRAAAAAGRQRAGVAPASRRLLASFVASLAEHYLPLPPPPPLPSPAPSPRAYLRRRSSRPTAAAAAAAAAASAASAPASAAPALLSPPYDSISRQKGPAWGVPAVAVPAAARRRRSSYDSDSDDAEFSSPETSEEEDVAPPPPQLQAAAVVSPPLDAEEEKARKRRREKADLEILVFGLSPDDVYPLAHGLKRQVCAAAWGGGDAATAVAVAGSAADAPFPSSSPTPHPPSPSAAPQLPRAPRLFPRGFGDMHATVRRHLAAWAAQAQAAGHGTDDGDEARLLRSFLGSAAAVRGVRAPRSRRASVSVPPPPPLRQQFDVRSLAYRSQAAPAAVDGAVALAGAAPLAGLSHHAVSEDVHHFLSETLPAAEVFSRVGPLATVYHKLLRLEEGKKGDAFHELLYNLYYYCSPPDEEQQTQQTQAQQGGGGGGYFGGGQSWPSTSLSLQGSAGGGGDGDSLFPPLLEPPGHVQAGVAPPVLLATAVECHWQESREALPPPSASGQRDASKVALFCHRLYTSADLAGEERVLGWRRGSGCVVPDIRRTVAAALDVVVKAEMHAAGAAADGDSSDGDAAGSDDAASASGAGGGDGGSGSPSGARAFEAEFRRERRRYRRDVLREDGSGDDDGDGGGDKSGEDRGPFTPEEVEAAWADLRLWVKVLFAVNGLCSTQGSVRTAALPDAGGGGGGDGDGADRVLCCPRSSAPVPLEEGGRAVRVEGPHCTVPWGGGRGSGSVLLGMFSVAEPVCPGEQSEEEASAEGAADTVVRIPLSASAAATVVLCAELMAEARRRAAGETLALAGAAARHGWTIGSRSDETLGRVRRILAAWAERAPRMPVGSSIPLTFAQAGMLQRCVTVGLQQAELYKRHLYFCTVPLEVHMRVNLHVWRAAREKPGDILDELQANLRLSTDLSVSALLYKLCGYFGGTESQHLASALNARRARADAARRQQQRAASLPRAAAPAPAAYAAHGRYKQPARQQQTHAQQQQQQRSPTSPVSKEPTVADMAGFSGPDVVMRRRQRGSGVGAMATCADDAGREAAAAAAAGGRGDGGNNGRLTPLDLLFFLVNLMRPDSKERINAFLCGVGVCSNAPLREIELALMELVGQVPADEAVAQEEEEAVAGRGRGTEENAPPPPPTGAPLHLSRRLRKWCKTVVFLQAFCTSWFQRRKDSEEEEGGGAAASTADAAAASVVVVKGFGSLVQTKGQLHAVAAWAAPCFAVAEQDSGLFESMQQSHDCDPDDVAVTYRLRNAPFVLLRGSRWVFLPPGLVFRVAAVEEVPCASDARRTGHVNVTCDVLVSGDDAAPAAPALSCGRGGEPMDANYSFDTLGYPPDSLDEAFWAVRRLNRMEETQRQWLARSVEVVAVEAAMRAAGARREAAAFQVVEAVHEALAGHLAQNVAARHFWERAAVEGGFLRACAAVEAAHAAERWTPQLLHAAAADTLALHAAEAAALRTLLVAELQGREAAARGAALEEVRRARAQWRLWRDVVLPPTARVWAAEAAARGALRCAHEEGVARGAVDDQRLRGRATLLRGELGGRECAARWRAEAEAVHSLRRLRTSVAHGWGAGAIAAKRDALFRRQRLACCEGAEVVGRRAAEGGWAAPVPALAAQGACLRGVCALAAERAAGMAKLFAEHVEVRFRTNLAARLERHHNSRRVLAHEELEERALLRAFHLRVLCAGNRLAVESAEHSARAALEALAGTDGDGGGGEAAAAAAACAVVVGEQAAWESLVDTRRRERSGVLGVLPAPPPPLAIDADAAAAAALVTARLPPPEADGAGTAAEAAAALEDAWQKKTGVSVVEELVGNIAAAAPAAGRTVGPSAHGVRVALARLCADLWAACGGAAEGGGQMRGLGAAGPLGLLVAWLAAVPGRSVEARLGARPAVGEQLREAFAGDAGAAARWAKTACYLLAVQRSVHDDGAHTVCTLAIGGVSSRRPVRRSLVLRAAAGGGGADAVSLPGIRLGGGLVLVPGLLEIEHGHTVSTFAPCHSAALAEESGTVWHLLGLLGFDAAATFAAAGAGVESLRDVERRRFADIVAAWAREEEKLASTWRTKQADAAEPPTRVPAVEAAAPAFAAEEPPAAAVLGSGVGSSGGGGSGVGAQPLAKEGASAVTAGVGGASTDCTPRSGVLSSTTGVTTVEAAVHTEPSDTTESTTETSFSAGSDYSDESLEESEEEEEVPATRQPAAEQVAAGGKAVPAPPSSSAVAAKAEPPAAPPAPAPPVELPSNWDCGQCTFSNRPEEGVCEMCGSSRPPASPKPPARAAAPAAAPVRAAAPQTVTRAAAAAAPTPPPQTTTSSPATPSKTSATAAVSASASATPAPQQRQSIWACPQCTLQNPADEASCVACDAPRPKQQPAAATPTPTPTPAPAVKAAPQPPSRVQAGPPPATDWACSSCTFENKASVTVCAVCRGPRSPPVQAAATPTPTPTPAAAAATATARPPQKSSAPVAAPAQAASPKVAAPAAAAAATASAPLQPAPWPCAQCTFNNPAAAKVCDMCDAPKPTEKPSEPRLTEAQAAPPAAPQQAAPQAAVPAPPQPAVPTSASWACPQCTYENAAGTTRCGLCDSAPPPPPAAAAPVQPKPSPTPTTPPPATVAAAAAAPPADEDYSSPDESGSAEDETDAAARAAAPVPLQQQDAAKKATATGSMFPADDDDGESSDDEPAAPAAATPAPAEDPPRRGTVPQVAPRATGSMLPDDDDDDDDSSDED